MGMHLVFSEIGTTSTPTRAITNADAAREPTTTENVLSAIAGTFNKPYQPTRTFWEQRLISDANAHAQSVIQTAQKDAEITRTNTLTFARDSRDEAQPTFFTNLQHSIANMFAPEISGSLIIDPLGKAKPSTTAFGTVSPIATKTVSEHPVEELYDARVAGANSKVSQTIGAANGCGSAIESAARANAQQLANLEDVDLPNIPSRTIDWETIDPQQEWRGEFIEIHNPSQKALSLRHYYLTDGTYVSTEDKAIFQEQARAYQNWHAQKEARAIITQQVPDINPNQLTGNYYWLITTDPSRSGGGTWGDFHAQFHPEAVIGPGETQIIALSATGFKDVYGFLPTYEIINTHPDVMDVIPAYPGAIDYDIITPLLSDVTTEGELLGETIKNPSGAGEMLAMYYWNGESKLVQDIDYVVWGDERKTGVDKTGITIGNEHYLWDAPVQFDGDAIDNPVDLESTRTFAEKNNFAVAETNSLAARTFDTFTVDTLTTTTIRTSNTAFAALSATDTSNTLATVTRTDTTDVAVNTRIAATNTLSANDAVHDLLAGETLATALTNNRLPLSTLSPPVKEIPAAEGCHAESLTATANLAETVPADDFDAAAERIAQGGIYQIPIPVPQLSGQPSLDLEPHPYLPGVFSVSKDQTFSIATIFGSSPEEALEQACPDASATSITQASRTLTTKNVVVNIPDMPSISFPDLNSRPTTVLLPGGTPLLTYAEFVDGRGIHDNTELAAIKNSVQLASLKERLPPLLSKTATARRDAALTTLNTNTLTTNLATPQTLAAAELEQGIITYQRDPCQPENEPDEEKSTVKIKELNPAPVGSKTEITGLSVLDITGAQVIQKQGAESTPGM
ncbi:MAG: hypothetical protein AABY01_03250, partial [Nanoarchaeota archaeon]